MALSTRNARKRASSTRTASRRRRIGSVFRRLGLASEAERARYAALSLHWPGSAPGYTIIITGDTNDPRTR